MASQLAIEITLADATIPILAWPGTSVGTAPTYGVTNVNLIPEVLEFDAKYDEMFLAGLREGGVPIKFSSWHTFIFSTNSSSNLNLLIAERSRSVRALFAVQRRATPVQGGDTGALIYDSSTFNSSGNTLQQYQYRIGSRYFPAAPVQCSFTPGGFISNGGSEAFIELQKSLNCVGDYRLSTSLTSNRWALPPFAAPIGNSGSTFTSSLSEHDYGPGIISFDATGHPNARYFPRAATTPTGSAFMGGLGSSAFCMSTDLQTSNGIEIAGLNAEEQSDISLLVNWSGPQANTHNIEVYSYFDAMIILRENNVMELVQ